MTSHVLQSVSPVVRMNGRRMGTSFSTERTLSLGQLTRSDSGVYTCSVDNSDDTLQVTKNIDVTVNVRCKYIM